MTRLCLIALVPALFTLHAGCPSDPITYECTDFFPEVAPGDTTAVSEESGCSAVGLLTNEAWNQEDFTFSLLDTVSTAAVRPPSDYVTQSWDDENRVPVWTFDRDAPLTQPGDTVDVAYFYFPSNPLADDEPADATIYFTVSARDQERHNLLVSASENGQVTAPPTRIDCGGLQGGATCLVSYSPEEAPDLQLIATPDVGYACGVWEGDGCTATTDPCVADVDTTRSVECGMRFDPADSIVVHVSGAGTGVGRVTASDLGVDVNCLLGPTVPDEGRCRAVLSDVRPGDTLLLVARPNPGSTFTGWSGCSSTRGTECELSFAAVAPPAVFDVTASFDVDPANVCNTTFGTSAGYIVRRIADLVHVLHKARRRR